MLRTTHRTIEFPRPLVMGIVNVTPDSFSDGGRWFSVDQAVQHGLELVADGADMLDIGGESTRPDSTPVGLAEELRRVAPVVERLALQVSIPISIDTMKAEVASRCIDLGAEIINDVSGLRAAEMVETALRTKAAVIVMHMQGTPQTMQLDPNYDDVVREIGQFFEERLRTLTEAGIELERIALDPGIGFGKQSTHNWQLLASLSHYQCFARPICLGVSRKGFLGKDRPPLERVIPGLAVACHAIAAGAAQIIRTHDVKATREAIDTLESIRAHSQ